MTIETTRRSVVAGLAAAPVAALPAAAAGGAQDLDALIAAHKRALAAHHAAIDAEQEAQAAFRAAHPEGFLVPNGLGAHYSAVPFERDEIKKQIAENFDLARDRLTQAERLAPGSTALAIAAFAAKEAEALAAVDTIFNKEAGQVEATEKRLQEASEADNAAALAICAHPCTTIEEVRCKATYAATIPAIADLDGDELALAFIRSLAGLETSS